jgi:probable HAF family extracellular repeat protein
MRHFYRYVLVLAAILMLAGATAVHADTFPYQTLDYPNADLTHAKGINNEGQIVGTYNDGSGAAHGYLMSGGVYTGLDYPGGTYTIAWGINDGGQIVGQTKSAGRTHGFLLSGEVYTNIDYPGAWATEV